jgi:DNA-binding transcriptional LysR family regulator
MLDIHQLNVFLVAAETLNFTQAAQRLHMTQPSVSQHIQSLERHFDNTLFVRSGRNIELTDAGIALVAQAREAVALSIRIEESMASLKGNVFGHLIVGCSTTPGKYVLPQLLARFHNRYPEVRITCQVTSQNRALDMLCDGNAHYALCSMDSDYSPEIEFEKFLRDDVVLVAPLSHPWALRGEIDPEELCGADFILREEGSGTFTAVQQALAEVGIAMHELHTLLTLGNSEAIAMAVEEELGVGFVSEMVADKIGDGRLARVTVNHLDISRDIYIGHNTRRPATVAQTAFWNFIHSRDNPLIPFLNEGFLMPER